MAVWMRFALILALSLPIGMLGYFAPSSLVERATNLRTAHPLLVRLAPAIGLALAISIYVAIFSAMSIMRHMALGTHAFDLGVYDQVIWNSSQGRLFEFSLSETPSAADTFNYLGFHFSPGLLFLVPVYWLIPDPRALLVVQTVAVASMAIPVYLLATHTLHHRMAALGLAAGYLLTPATGYINLFDFHSVALAMPSIALATYFLVKRKYAGWGILMLLAMSFKEDIAIVTIAMGLYMAFRQRKWMIGAVAVVGGMLWLYLAVEVVIPEFRGNSYYYLSQYSYLGQNLGQVALSLLLQPVRIIEILTDPARWEFALHLFVPLGLTPLLSPAALLMTAPIFAYLFASSDPAKYSIIFHYSSPIVALLFVAAAQGIPRLEGMLRRVDAMSVRQGRPVLLSIICFVLATSAISYYFHGSGPLSIGFDPESYRPLPGDSAVFTAISLIPPDATVSAHRDIAPHLTHRRFIYLFPNIHHAEYLLLWEGNQDGAGTSELQEWQQQVRAALSDQKYELMIRENGFVLMRRRAEFKATEITDSTTEARRNGI